jgi:hypothetical protein
MIDATRAQKLIGPGLRMYHQPGPEKPLLWMSDILAGAVAHRGGEPMVAVSVSAGLRESKLSHCVTRSSPTSATAWAASSLVNSRSLSRAGQSHWVHRWIPIEVGLGRVYG